MPIVDILPRHILGEAVTLLKRTFELIALAVDLVEIVNGKLAHFSLIWPLACFQFPSMRFRSISWRIFGYRHINRAARGTVLKILECNLMELRAVRPVTFHN